MRLLVDTRNGLAGDIMAAGLIGLGAGPGGITGAMETAGNTMGKTNVKHLWDKGVHRLSVDFRMPGHLHASEARTNLDQALRDAGITEPWKEMAKKVLGVMTEAEGHVHSHHPALKRHYHGPEPVLHEASDILIDIVGMSAGMMALGITEIEYLDYVNVGGGEVKFSHGTLEVPTPATKYILETKGIIWKRSETGMEMTTPTGASILAGCGAKRTMAEPEGCRPTLAGGTRPLPPISFYLCNPSIVY